MKGALKLIKGKGYLTSFNPTTAAEYLLEIKTEISKLDQDNLDFSILANIFDLIQAWGGITGRTPYVLNRGKKYSSRENYDSWKEYYLQGVINAQNGLPVDALKEWIKIDGIGASFAPKHLRFWTNQYPVLDSRISVLLCGSKRLLQNPECYAEFLSLISELSIKFELTPLETETSLFAFSKNYFVNDKLKFSSNKSEDRTDSHIADILVSLNT